VDSQVKLKLAVLERRCRTLTGLILAVLAFAASYGILLYEGQTERPAFHFYPWLLAVLFYLGGDLLAWVWFKIIVMQLATLLSSPRYAQQPEESQEAVRPGGAEKAEAAERGE
jgi:Zn-dependent protease with chaperone function